MAETVEPSTFEGTWEEVAERAGDLSGKRVTLTVHPQEARGARERGILEYSRRSLADLLAPLLEKADQLDPEPPALHGEPQEAALDAILRKKAARLGLKV